MEDNEIVDFIASRIEANRVKAEKVKQPQTLNIPAIYAQAYEQLLFDLEIKIEQRNWRQ